ncbi:cation-dependent mannose-6-phosphate receptor-like [Ptychodera flava]|uniref:cation-dependent mannose-6-phosphate receptor-like n=1 Tax=Ptychodera flava TaxID=63121 RepID=UPI00396A47CC
MNTDITLLLLFCVFCLFCSVEADCKVGDSELKYLSILDPIKGKKISVSDSGKDYSYKYDIGICTGVGDTDDVGVMQSDLKSSSPSLVNVGLITSTHIQEGTDWLLLTYRDGKEYASHCNKEKRKAVIMLVCDPKNLIGSATIIAENNNKTSECYYLFEVGSSVVCETSSSGLSVGSVICIIFFVLVAVYILGGVLYQRCVLGAKGMEQFPNITFWREFGNLVADGTDFVFRNTPKGQPKTYKGIGDDQLADMDEEDERDDHLLPM